MELSRNRQTTPKPLMHRIPHLSAEEIQEIIENEEKCWLWISEAVYDKLCVDNCDHLLVRVGKRFRFEEMVKRCQGYRRHCGKEGQAATHTLEQLCRTSVVKGLYGWSYERVAEEVRRDPLLRWFVGYQMNEATLSDTTLWHFERWLQAHEARLLFSELLLQIRADFPATRPQIQVGDTFAMQSVCRQQSRTEMMREGCHSLLSRLQQVCEPAYEAVVQELDHKRLFGEEKEVKEWWMDKTERAALEIRTAYGATECVHLVRREEKARQFPHSIEYAGVRHWLGLVEKVLNDEFEVAGAGRTEAEAEGKAKEADIEPKRQTSAPTQASQANCVGQIVAGQPIILRLRNEHAKGSYALGSVKDPEASFRLHGDKTTFGYNINLAADGDFVTEINGVTGATPDSSGVATLIANQKTYLGTLPDKLVYDRAAGRAFFFAQVAKVSDGQTQLVARLIDTGKNATRFTPSDFSLNAPGQLTCPNGKSTSTAYRSGSADGWEYRFKADDCKGCPLWDKCRTPHSKPTASRNVFISDYLYEQRNALAYTKSAEFQSDMAAQPAIERIIAALTRYNGGRQNKGRGVRNADAQARTAAIAYNLKRWCVLTLEKEADACYKPPDDG